jgi:serine/threonine protein kinase
VERFALTGYVVEELIGFGGTGEVWRAREVDTGEIVALKRLRARGAAATERLRREAGLLATLAGPHVVGVRRMVVVGEEAVMVMDHAAGGNLATVLAVRGWLPAPEVVTIVAPIAAALAAAHSRDLVHGDITPANILFSGDGRPLLADFGVARAMGADVGQLEATIDFLDPAVAAGGGPTPASDVFALGAVAFTALAGHSLWGSGTPDERLARAAAGQRPPLRDVLPDLSPAVAEVLDSMLSAEPDQRPDARSLGAAILRSSPVAPVGLVHKTRPPPPPTNLVRPLRPTSPPADDIDDDAAAPRASWRKRIVLVAAAALALVGAMGLGVSLAHAGHGAAPLAGTDPPIASIPETAASPSASSISAPTSWTQVVAHLDALRADAFDHADAAPLAQVYAPGAVLRRTRWISRRSGRWPVADCMPTGSRPPSST